MPAIRNILTEQGFSPLGRREMFDITRNSPLPSNVGANVSLPNINQQIPNSGIDFSKLTIDKLYVGQTIQSAGFITGVAGWFINGNGDVEFNNGVFRGTVTASTFIGGEIHIPDENTTADSFHTNTDGDSWWGCTEDDFDDNNDNAQAYILSDGTLKAQKASVKGVFEAGLIRTATFEKAAISSIGGAMQINQGSDILTVAMTALNSSTLTISGDMALAVGDILRIKDGVNDEWMEVTNIGSAPTYTVTRDKAGTYAPDANPAWQSDSTVVNYGQSGDGFIEMITAVSNSPYIKIATHTGTPWVSTDTKVLIGQLQDKTGNDEFGLWIKSGAAYIAGYRLFGAVVDAGGLGDYLTIADAISAGETSIFIRNGSYTITGDLDLPNGCSIQGESYGGVLINMGTTGRMRVNSSSSIYLTGTISATAGSATITGSGTSWLANVVAGDYIRISGYYYEVATVNSNTSITITRAFDGVDVTGQAYVVGDFYENISLVNLSFTKTGSSANIAIYNTFNIKMLYCQFQGGLYGLQLVENINFTTISNNTFLDCTVGIATETTSTFSYIENNTFALNIMHGGSIAISIDSDFLNNNINENSILNNNLEGIVFNIGSMQRFVSNSVTNNVLSLNEFTGIDLGTEATVEHYGNVFSRNQISQCGVGFDIGSPCSSVDDSCVDCSSTSISISSNNVSVKGALVDNGGAIGIDVNPPGSSPVDFSGVQIEGCRITNSTTSGIRCIDANGVFISGNIIKDNGTRGIEITDSSGVLVSENVITGSGNYGIYVETTSDSAVIQGNKIYDNNIGSNGIWCRGNGNRVNNNSVYGQTNAEAIKVDGDNNQINNNYCYDSSYGISLEGEQNMANANFCFNNGNVGILCNGDRNVCQGNQCYGNADIGISSLAVGAGFHNISGNFCYDNTSHGISSAVDGNMISGNYCHTNGGDGIFINDDGQLVSGNFCYTNTGDGIEVNGAAKDRVLVNNNVCTSNSAYGILFDNNPTSSTCVGNITKSNTSGNLSGAAGANSQFANNVTA